jgi:hypothetical protein
MFIAGFSAISTMRLGCISFWSTRQEERCTRLYRLVFFNTVLDLALPHLGMIFILCTGDPYYVLYLALLIS